MRWRWAAGLFVIALVALLPLRLAAGWAGLADLGLTAREVSGSLWNGTMSEARLAGIDLGELDAAVDPLALLAGRVRIDLSGTDESRGSISIGHGGFGIDDVTARLPLGSTFAPLPLSALDLDDVSMRFRDGTCVAADGRARAAIDGSAIGLSLPGGLSGNARCDGGALLLPLVSRSAMEMISIRLFGDDRYQADLFLRSREPAFGQRLRAIGFVPRGPGYVLSVGGSFGDRGP
jgi:general secretion pathway protein N